MLNIIETTRDLYLSWECEQQLHGAVVGCVMVLCWLAKNMLKENHTGKKRLKSQDMGIKYMLTITKIKYHSWQVIEIKV